MASKLTYNKLKGGTRMKLRMTVGLALCIGLVCAITGIQGYTQGEPQITVYNPMGTPPPIKIKAMAPRLDTIDGKTIYLVNTGFPNSGPFMQAMRDWFNEHHPKTNIVVAASGSMTSINEKLKAEIKEKADAVFFGLGH